MSENLHFGRKIRQLRHQAGLNQRTLAATCGIDFTYLSKIENGHQTPPSEEAIRRLADALRADPEWLLACAGKLSARLKLRARADPKFCLLLWRIAEMPWSQVETVFHDIVLPSEQKGGE